MTILVVEDDPLVRMVTSESFRDLGWAVYEAASCPEAIAVLDERKDVCAVFTDIEMPGVGNGLTLAHYVHRKSPELPVFITSGRMLPWKQELPSGARFIAKPYDIAVVSDQIRSSMNSF
jgi:CheY-like chemotaxis protein